MTQKMQDRENGTETEIDLMRLAKLLWHKLWLILLVAILCAGLAFCYSRFLITPQYSSTVMLYVNSSSLSIGDVGVSLSSSEITASRSLVATYIVILQNRTTMEQIIEKTGVSYSYRQLLGMISAKAVNNTEVFAVTVTSADAEEAALIANAIAEVLPLRVSEVIDGTSMRLVDGAEINYNKVSPSNTKYTAIGLVIGLVLACGVIVLRDLLDSTLRDDDYLFESLDIPILTKIPDLCAKDSGKYYYSHYGHHYGGYEHTGSDKADGGKS